MGNPAGSKGFVSVVLHAHLPFIRYPENAAHLEERWLFEAMAETYIPLLRVFDNLLRDKVDFRVTLSLTPTLVEMLTDTLLMDRFRTYLEGLIELTDKEKNRIGGKVLSAKVITMYRKRFAEIRRLFTDVYKGDLIAAFCNLLRSGKVEILAGAATHPFLPALGQLLPAARAQILLGVRHFQKTFGKNPNGIWLPECGFTPPIDPLLREAGINYCFLEGHGVPGPGEGGKGSLYFPVKTPSGICVFARDVWSSRQVWSSVEGYPGDFNYRDFYRDIGFDLDLDYLRLYLPGGIRTFTGLKYYRITGPPGRKKMLYVREKALERVKAHADHFIKERQKQILELKARSGRKPVVTAAYDAELFGHWWFEGPEWLDAVFRQGSRQNVFKFITSPEYLHSFPCTGTAKPGMSSWGDKGYGGTWINEENEWIYRHIHHSSEAMIEMAERHMNARGILKRGLNQAARELLLSQASDWAFMMKTGNAGEFAKNKFKEHISNFLELEKQVRAGEIQKAFLAALESKNNIFREMDFRIFSRKHNNIL